MSVMNSSTISSIWKNSSLLFLSRVLGFALVILMQMVLVRQLCVEEYGEFRKILMFLYMVITIFTLGIHNSVVYFLKSSQAKESRALYITSSLTLFAIIGVSLALALLLFHINIAGFLNIPYISRYPWPLALYLLFMFLSGILEKIFISDEKYANVFWLILLTDIATTLLTLILLGLVQSLQMLLWCFVLIAFIRFIWLILYIYDDLLLDKTGLYAALKAQLMYALPLGLATFFEIGRMELHKLIISRYLPAVTFAIYITGCLKVPFVEGALFSIGDVLNVDFVKYHSRGEQLLMISIWKNVLEKLMLLFFPMALFLILFAKEIFLFLYTSKFNDSVVVFQILTLALFFNFTCSNILMRVLNRTKCYLALAFITFIFSIALLLWTVKISYIAVAIVSLLTNFLMELSMFILVTRELGVAMSELFNRCFLFKLGFCLCFGALFSRVPMLLVNENLPLIRILLGGSLFAFSYLYAINFFALIPQTVVDKVVHGMQQMIGCFKKRGAMLISSLFARVSLYVLALLGLSLHLNLATGSEELLKSGDKLGLHFYFPKDSEFTKGSWEGLPSYHALIVDDKGVIIVPLIGEVKAASLGVKSVESKIQKELSKRFSNPPIITTWVAARQKIIQIYGMVQNPQKCVVRDEADFVAVLAKAGGAKAGADLDAIKIYSEGGKELSFSYIRYMEDPLKYPLPPLKSLDTVFVPPLVSVGAVDTEVSKANARIDQKSINVIGAVNHPGFISYSEEMSLADIISKVGGLRPDYKDDRLVIYRALTSPQENSYEKIVYDDIFNNQEIRPIKGDVLYFPFRPQETALDKVSKVGGVLGLILNAIILIILIH
ncbi:MAG: SLBB domain-containing protein [Oligoflexia bacterium]|nr:SLBB domain-containing protein [Oligoflexia bacterium]